MEKYTLGKYIYFDFLVLINHQFFPEINTTDNMRSLSEEELTNINNKLATFFVQIKLTNDIKQIAKLILDLTGYIWLLQPFRDGNTRTLRFFLKMYFDQINYDIDLNITSEETFIIPIFYSEDEECNNNAIDNLIRRLSKKTNL